MKKYYLFLIKKPETTVAEDVEADYELKQKLLQAKTGESANFG